MRAAIVETDSKQTIFRLISSSWFHYGESQAEQLEEYIESCLHWNVSPIVGELNGKGRGREIVWPTGNKRWSTIRFIPKHIWWCSSSFAPISLRFRIPPCCAIDFHRKKKNYWSHPPPSFYWNARPQFSLFVCALNWTKWGPSWHVSRSDVHLGKLDVPWQSYGSRWHLFRCRCLREPPRRWPPFLS